MKLLLSLAVLLALAPAASETLAFGPKEGTKLEKRFEMRMDLSKRSMTLTMGGQELPKEIGEQARMEFVSKKEVVVVDEYRKIDGARPLLLSRHYAKLFDEESSEVEMAGMPEPQEEKKEKKSALLDKHVLFRWNADKDVYEKEWDGEKGDNDLLDGLEEDMDLRELLPDKKLADGDTWEIDLKEFGELLGPGGKLGFMDDDDKEDDDFEKNLKGTATCTYKGIEEVGGRKLARIAATCKATSSFDKVDDEGANMEMQIEFELEGKFLWDVDASHLASYELEGDVTGKLEIKQEIDIGGGQKHELQVHVDLGGKLGVSAEFTKP